MGNLFKLINAHYDLFESFRRVLYIKNKLIWLFLLATSMFIYSFHWYMNKDAFPHFPNVTNEWRLFVSILMEILVLFIWFLLLRQREKLIIKEIQEYFQSKETKLHNLRKLWFTTCVDSDFTKYLEIAEKIDKVLNMREKYKSNFTFDAKQFGLLIFQPESKNRLLAMFMGVSAAIIGLTIATGANIYNIFDFFRDNSFWSILTLDLIFSIFIMFAIVIGKLILLILFEICVLWGDKLDKEKAISKRRSRIFINQLLFFYSLPKPKIRIKNLK
ncbi:hypothetical protein ACG95N_19430 [Acinetobacter guillouiae]|uniref:hypothetical protein n=1 Tax=Acinetobacter guillouiae TaxID=106649 RepID=UPI003AF7B600